VLVGNEFSTQVPQKQLLFSCVPAEQKQAASNCLGHFISFLSPFSTRHQNLQQQLRPCELLLPQGG